MKKITFLMLHLNYGGIEKQVSTLANELAKDDKRYSIQVISVYKILDKPFYELNPNIKVKYLIDCGPNKKEIKEALKKFNIIKLFKELFKGLKIVCLKSSLMKKEIANLDTDVIVSSRIEFSKYIKRKNTLNISQEHSYIESKSYIKKVRTSFSYIDYLVVMTEGAKKKYEEWLRPLSKSPKIICVPNMIQSVDENKICNIESKSIISVGRLEKIKDFETLIDVFNKISIAYPDWKLTIVGEGNDRKNIEAKIKTYGLESKIILTGSLSEDDIVDRYMNSSIFVLASKSESFSLVLCEAMSYGIPCISFDVDMGPREIIKDNETGFLVKNNSKEEMIKKLKRLIEDENLRIEFSKKSKEQVKKFYSQNLIKTWKILFDIKKSV